MAVVCRVRHLGRRTLMMINNALFFLCLFVFSISLSSISFNGRPLEDLLVRSRCISVLSYPSPSLPFLIVHYLYLCYADWLTVADADPSLVDLSLILSDTLILILTSTQFGHTYTHTAHFDTPRLSHHFSSDTCVSPSLVLSRIISISCCVPVQLTLCFSCILSL